MTLSLEIQHRFNDFAIDMAFSADESVTGLFGASGAGKSTLIRILAGLLRPHQGRIVFEGETIIDTQQGVFLPAHRRRFACVFQEARLFPHLNVRKNLLYGTWFTPKQNARNEFNRIIELLGIEHLLRRMPVHLSGGEKQRVAIGRALLSFPRLLLLDEPLAALDQDRKADIIPYLERLRDQTKVPIIYVSHSVSEMARLANEVVLLQQGRVVASGPTLDILNRPGLSESKHDAGVLLEGTVADFDAVHGLLHVDLHAARLHVPSSFLPPGTKIRIRIPARDVMLAKARPDGLSALNALKGRITQITRKGFEAEITLDCWGNPLIARITSLSLERLDLEIGMVVFAIVKTVALEF